MESFFSALNKRQTMLLLTAVTYGGQESVGALGFLPEEEAEILQDRAQKILEIPREKRIPLLVNEIKRLVTAKRGQLWSADPKRIAEVLKKERPALIEVILRALPAEQAEGVRKHLPPMKPGVSREVRPEVLKILRWKLDEGLAKAAPNGPGFKFSDMILLKSRELITVIDRMGARSLALAIAGLPKEEQDAFLQKLAPDQRSLATRAAKAGEARKLKPVDARELLSRYDEGKGPLHGLRNAGVQRVARACLAQAPEFAERMVERHPGDLGKLLQKWIRIEKPKVSGKADFGRADIVEQLERLEAKGMIDRPIRLPPPTQAILRKPTPAPLPGGKVLLPPPRLRSSEPRSIAPLPSRPVAKLDPAPRRDPIAEREARRAGAAPSRPRQGMDPIAAREARRAGVPIRPNPELTPGPSRPVRAAQVPPQRSGVRKAYSPTVPPPARPPADHTSLQRAPRIVGRGPKGPRRGPGDGSG